MLLGVFKVLAFCLSQLVVPSANDRPFVNEHVVEIHAVSSKESEDIFRLKKQALNQIRSNDHVVNITEYFNEANSIDFVVRAYSSPRLNLLEKSVQGMLYIGEVYYDEANRAVLVIPPGGDKKIRFLYVELDNNLYDVSLREGDSPSSGSSS